MTVKSEFSLAQAGDRSLLHSTELEISKLSGTFCDITNVFKSDFCRRASKRRSEASRSEANTFLLLKKRVFEDVGIIRDFLLVDEQDLAVFLKLRK